MTRILTFTTLYPSVAHDTHGLFVERRLRHIVETGRVSAHVVVPVPWFPSTNARFGRLAVHARTPRREERHGIQIDHPRYASIPIPKLGSWCVPFTMAHAGRRHIEQLDEPFDLIDAHFLYPDGVAAARIARRLDKPLVMTARGSDVNTWPNDPVVKRRILEAADQAAATITVSGALKEEMQRLGADGDKIVVLRNGVDLGHFKIGDRAACKSELGLEGHVILCVGHLDADKKGQGLIIDAMPHVPNATLVLVGYGPSRSALEQLARDRGVEDRVRFIGAVSPDDLPRYYAAADVYVLASRREGMPNVVLEALACGVPVVATRVGGVGEIVTHPDMGILLDDRDPASLAAAVKRVIEAAVPQADIRARAEAFSWLPIAAAQADLYETAVSAHRSRSSPACAVGPS